MKKIFISMCLISALNAHTLEQVFSLVSNFGSISAEYAAARASQAKAASAKASYLPKIDFIAGASMNTKSVDLLAPKQAAKAGVELNWLLFDLSRDAMVQSADVLANLATLRAQNSQELAQIAAAKAYYSHMALSAASKAVDAQCKALKRANSDLDRLVASGLKEQDEAQMIQAALAECKAQLAQLGAQAATLQANLNALTGENILINASTSEQPLDESALEIAAAAVSTQNLETKDNLSVKQAKLASELKDHQHDAAKAKFSPQLLINAQSAYVHSQLRYDNFGPLGGMLEANGKENSFASSVNIGVKFNLFNGMHDMHELEAAKLERLMAKNNLIAAKAKQQADIAANSALIEASKIALEAAKERQSAAIAASKSVERKYRAGLLGYADFLRTQAAAAAASAQMASIQAQLAIAGVERAYLIGE